MVCIGGWNLSGGTFVVTYLLEKNLGVSRKKQLLSVTAVPGRQFNSCDVRERVGPRGYSTCEAIIGSSVIASNSAAFNALGGSFERSFLRPR
jgi:hypothetical protein